MKKYICIRKDTPKFEGWENWFKVGNIYKEYTGFLNIFRPKALLYLYSKNSFGKQMSPFQVNKQCFLELKCPEKVKSIKYFTKNGSIIDIYDFDSLTITCFLNEKYLGRERYDSASELKSKLSYLHETLTMNDSKFEYTSVS